jgi:hypothetical protein
MGFSPQGGQETGEHSTDFRRLSQQPCRIRGLHVTDPFRQANLRLKLQ